MPASSTNARPLAGLKVLELGQLIAGPFAGKILAEFGAEVIKIESPDGGDPLRHFALVVRPGAQQEVGDRKPARR
jgi:formyl-CoA transferase